MEKFFRWKNLSSHSWMNRRQSISSIFESIKFVISRDQENVAQAEKRLCKDKVDFLSRNEIEIWICLLERKEHAIGSPPLAHGNLYERPSLQCTQGSARTEQQFFFIHSANKYILCAAQPWAWWLHQRPSQMSPFLLRTHAPSQESDWQFKLTNTWEGNEGRGSPPEYACSEGLSQDRAVFIHRGRERTLGK